MKKLIAGVLFVYCLLPPVYSQIKITKATSQKTIAGMGGVFITYEVGLKNKTTDSLVIDSVKTMADTSEIQYYLNKVTKPYIELGIRIALTDPPKCRTCPDTKSHQANLTKGIMIYYRKGNKKLTCKVKKFKELEEKLTP